MSSNRRFSITWCYEIPEVGEDGYREADLDHAKYAVEYRATFEEAIGFAKTLLHGTDKFGSVEVNEERIIWDKYKRRHVWEQWADLYVDDVAATYADADLRTCEHWWESDDD